MSENEFFRVCRRSVFGCVGEVSVLECVWVCWRRECVGVCRRSVLECVGVRRGNLLPFCFRECVGVCRIESVLQRGCVGGDAECAVGGSVLECPGEGVC